MTYIPTKDISESNALPTALAGMTMAVVNATIAAGATGLSGAVNLGGKAMVGIKMPAAWVAAPITFQVSADDGATFQDLYDSAGNEISVTTAAGRYVAIDPNLFLGINVIKVRSGPSLSPVNQTGGATVGVVTRL